MEGRARQDGLTTGTCAHGQHGRRLTGRGGAHGVGTLGEMLRRGRRGLRQGNPDRGRLRPHAGGQGAGEGRERREQDCTWGRGATSIRSPSELQGQACVKKRKLGNLGLFHETRDVCANRLNEMSRDSYARFLMAMKARNFRNDNE